MNILLISQTNRILFALAVQLLIWVETFGQIVGSFFGKMEFNVIGIGEIKKKTVEVTAAVFLSSFTSLLVVNHALVDSSTDLFIFGPVFTFFYHALISMVIEAGAPRSIDNFFFQVFGLYILLASFKYRNSFLCLL